MPEHQLTMRGEKCSFSGSCTHTDTHTGTKIAHAMADACRHDKHLRHSGNTRAGNVVKTEWLCTCLHITAGGAVSLDQQPVWSSLQEEGGGAGFSG